MYIYRPTLASVTTRDHLTLSMRGPYPPAFVTYLRNLYTRTCLNMASSRYGITLSSFKNSLRLCALEA